VRRARIAVRRSGRAIRHAVRLLGPALRSLARRAFGKRDRAVRRAAFWLKGGLAFFLAAVVLLAAAMVVSAFYDQYGSHPTRTEQSWAALASKFADAGTCASCHTPEALKWVNEAHRGAPCQSCHGPMAGHEGPGPVKTYEITGPDSRALCSSCHRKVVGRPATVKQVDPATHFQPGTCIECHDPHTTVALAPPRIPHPLNKLPDCKTCHGPDGLRAVPATHPFYENDQCRHCHEQLTP
jgi:hypothetical protein